MSIYDIIAKIANYIHSTNIEYEIVTDYICCYESDFTNKDLEELNDFFEEAKLSRLALSEYCEKIDALVDKLYKENKYLSLIDLISRLDNLVDREEVFYNEDESDVFEPLNTFTLEKAMVLPKVTKEINWKYSKDELSGNINTVLNCVYVVFISDIYGYNIINHYIDLEYRKSTFIVAGSPVCDNIKIDANEYLDENYIRKMTFNVSCSDKSNFVAKVINLLKLADEKKANVAAFPELISNSEINDEIINEIKLIDFKYLKFIALPTFYNAKSFQNIGCVYFTDQKRMIINQNKTFPYIKYNKSIKEKLSRNNDIHILHIKGVGRILFPICKDMLVDKYINLCRSVNANLIVARSFSPGLHGYKYFSRIIKGYTSFECCGFWINSCSYKPQPEESLSENKIFCIKSHSKDSNQDITITCMKNCDKCIETFIAN